MANYEKIVMKENTFNINYLQLLHVYEFKYTCSNLKTPTQLNPHRPVGKSSSKAFISFQRNYLIK